MSFSGSAGIYAVSDSAYQPPAMPDLVHRRLRAPTADGAALIDPPQEQFPGLIAHNRALAETWRAPVLDVPLADFRAGARTGLLRAATGYSADVCDVSWLPAEMERAPLVLAGHQPELFHSGVWFKNFLLSHTAQEARGIGINLIVDTDTVRGTSIRVPVRSGSDVAIENVPFDAPGEVVPFEERPVLDRGLFESFDRRVLAAYETCWRGGHYACQPIIVELWKRAIDAIGRETGAANLGRVLTQSRHWMEWQLGLRTLEIPLSNVARTPHYRQFAAHLLAELPRFWQIYNAALAEYRQANHIRSHTHPVPSLAEHHEWLEAPFLVWTKDDPRRRHLFAMRERNSLVLGDRQGLSIKLDLSADGRVEKAVEQLDEAESRGIKLRPRALITTMYARLVLSDLFIHGIGGAKYDELTDLIIRRFFGIEPPAYVTATATFRLPIERPDVSIDDVRDSARRIRELRYRPESFDREPLVKNDSQLSSRLEALAAEKREFLDQHDLRRCSPDVFDRLDRLNRAMHELLRPVEDSLREEHVRLAAQLEQSQLLDQREFSFVLFPSEILPARLLDLSKASS